MTATNDRNAYEQNAMGMAERAAARMSNDRLRKAIRQENARWVLARNRNDDHAADIASDAKVAYQNELQARKEDGRA